MGTDSSVCTAVASEALRDDQIGTVAAYEWWLKASAEGRAPKPSWAAATS